MKADTVLQVPGKSLAAESLWAQFCTRALGLPLPFVLGLMPEMLDVQESDDFPVTILFLAKLLLVTRALCFWFALLRRKVSTGTVIQKTAFVSFSKRWFETVNWCQEIGSFICCCEENFPFFFLSSSSMAKSSLVFLLSHTELWENSCILQMNRDTTVH